MTLPIIKIMIGDVFAELAKIPADSVDVVVTSPPYWGLRDYGVDGQIGLEATLGEHLDIMVRVFAEVRRVLKPSGTLWLNYGDCYATTPNGRSAADLKALGADDRGFVDKPFSTIQGCLKPKDLCMVPNRVAIALQESGWWVRSEIIWAKPNPMPESIKDRPATAHEKIFLLTKSPRYFYNADAVRQGRASDEEANGFRGGSYAGGAVGKRQSTGNKHVDKQRGHSRRHAGFNDRWDHMTKAEQSANGRSLRNWEPTPAMQVWPIATAPFKDAHFATFPPELVRRCLLAGCPPGGKVFDPFGGAGTTGLVAAQMSFDCDLIELNPDYARIAQKRIDLIFQGKFDTQARYGQDVPFQGMPLFVAVQEGM